jgi:hypothetical protein
MRGGDTIIPSAFEDSPLELSVIQICWYGHSTYIAMYHLAAYHGGIYDVTVVSMMLLWGLRNNFLHFGVTNYYKYGRGILNW